MDDRVLMTRRGARSSAPHRGPARPRRRSFGGRAARLRRDKPWWPSEIIAKHRGELGAKFGVKSLALFGSVARDEATPDSDVDFLVEFDGRPVGLFHLSRTQHYLEAILGVPLVDLAPTTASSPRSGNAL